MLFRVFVGRGEPKSHATIKQLWSISEAVLPKKHVFDFNQALMDFGATLCTARKPRCGECPMRRNLQVRAPVERMTNDEGRSDEDGCIVVAAAVVERDGAFLLTRRLKGTHLAGTWEFPGGKCEPSESPEDCLVREIAGGAGGRRPRW